MIFKFRHIRNETAKLEDVSGTQTRFCRSCNLSNFVFQATTSEGIGSMTHEISLDDSKKSMVFLDDSSQDHGERFCKTFSSFVSVVVLVMHGIPENERITSRKLQSQ